MSRSGPVNTAQHLSQWIPRIISLVINRPEHESHQSPPSEIKKENSYSLSVENDVLRCCLSMNLHGARGCGVQCTVCVSAQCVRVCVCVCVCVCVTSSYTQTCSQCHANSRKETRFYCLQIRASRFLNAFCQ